MICLKTFNHIAKSIALISLFLFFMPVVGSSTPAEKKNSASKILRNDVLHELQRVNFQGSRLSLNNLMEKYPETKEEVEKYLGELKTFESEHAQLIKNVKSNDVSAIQGAQDFLQMHRKAHLQNPLVKGKEIIAVRQIVDNARDAMAAQIGRNQNNWTTNASIPRSGWNNEICKISDPDENASVSRIYKTNYGYPVKDVDLHWDGKRILHSSIGHNRRWHIFELNLETGENKRITPIHLPEIDYFDACYLPDGNIIFASTASYVGVPCIGGSQPASDLYLYDSNTEKIRQLNYGQDCDWNPVVLNNGKVCYLRWEYTDNSHYFTRILMHMNPDGTAKKEYYGSGSYFPNSLFDARPIPGHPSQFVGVVSGHHGIARSGRLLVFDPVKGRKETDGVVQEIPGMGKKVEPIIKDKLVDGVWPQFLTPYPLSEDYFLVTAKMSKHELWGIYLVDRFDNMILVYNKEGEAYTEPIVLEERDTPPAIPSKVNEASKTSTVYISDIYEGPGLKGIPRGTVKNIRIYAYQYGYNRVGGHDVIGLEAGWDVKRILGTVPVEEDGSAMFTIPANTPISMQPLDESGSALQLMRSWMTAMPGEVVSCVGCHESQNTVVPSKFTMASRKRPAQLEEWYGPSRPVTYNNELKPVIEKRCVGCHNGDQQGLPNFADESDSGYHGFSKSYMALHPYVRRPGCESDFYTLEPMDFHSSTSDLVQMLRKGHHGVELNDEEWDRLITWIDMNVPYRGSYQPAYHGGFDQVERRDELLNYFGNVSLNGEKELAQADSLREAMGTITPVMPNAQVETSSEVKLKGWPIPEKKVKRLQEKHADNQKISKIIRLNDQLALEFVRIPAGRCVIGDNNGQPDQKESPATIDQAFWMLKTEVTNEIYRTIFPDHNSRHIDQQWKDHIYPGYEANRDEQPVIRVSWEEATEFCRILSEKTGLNIKLPSEAQWEWAARAGSATAMHYGNVSDNFSMYENLADYSLRDLAVIGVDPKPMDPKKNGRFRFYNFVPKVEKYNDEMLVPEGTAQYKPNAWGLYDMLGNVAEWTSSDYSYEGFGGKVEGSLKVAKGGSWRDRPEYATAASRDGYLPFQKVFNVGFRIIIEDGDGMADLSE